MRPLFSPLVLMLCLALPAVAADDIAAQYRKPVADWPRPTIDEGVSWQELAPLPPLPGDPMWSDKTRLGRDLFFERALSGSGQLACASCHDPDHAWADGRRVPWGHNRTPGVRNTPSLVNVVYLDALFWDGRARDLKSQVHGPLTNPLEMNQTPEGAVAALRVQPRYVAAFAKVYAKQQPLDYAQIVDALADFERTITSRRSRFDAFVAGRYSAMDDEEIRGLHWFRTQGRCMNCHSGPLLTDQKFHNIGIPFYGRPLPDPGRAGVSGDDADWGAFRTPPLRDVAFTAPYMHTGFLPGLSNVVAFYNKGGAQPPPPEDDQPARHISPLIRPLQLDARQQRELVRFLEALSERPNRLPLAYERQLRERAGPDR